MQTVTAAVNSLVLWLLAFGSILIVLWQTWIYYKMAWGYVKKTGVMTRNEVYKSIKVGVIGTIGPAIAVFTLAVVLIGLMGGPVTLSRIGVIGSATFESLTAAAGSGNTAGTPEFTLSMFATAAWVMALGGSGWLVTTFFFTKGLDTTQKKMKQMNPRIISMLGSITPFMVFFVLGYGAVAKKMIARTPSYGVFGAVVAGAVSMYGFNRLAETGSRFNWMREWAMGFAIIIAMIAGTLID